MKKLSKVGLIGFMALGVSLASMSAGAGDYMPSSLLKPTPAQTKDAVCEGAKLFHGLPDGDDLYPAGYLSKLYDDAVTYGDYKHYVAEMGVGKINGKLTGLLSTCSAPASM